MATDTRVGFGDPDKDYLGSSKFSKGGLQLDYFGEKGRFDPNKSSGKTNSAKPGSGTNNTKKTKKSSTQTKGNTYSSSSDGTGGLVQSTKPNNNPQTTAASLEGTGNKSASNSSWTFNKSTKETVVALNDRKAMKQEFRRRKKTGYDPQAEGKIVSDYASKDDKGAYKSGTAEWGRLDEKNKRLADKLNKKLDKKLDKPTGSRSKLFNPTSGNNNGVTTSANNNKSVALVFPEIKDGETWSNITSVKAMRESMPNRTQDEENQIQAEITRRREVLGINKTSPKGGFKPQTIKTNPPSTQLANNSNNKTSTVKVNTQYDNWINKNKKQ